MKFTYCSKNCAPENVLKRYVRRICSSGGYYFCEVGEDRRFDLRQGTVEAEELPEAVRQAADEHYKVSIFYIEWPF
jgi:hypothetical protein